MLNPHCLLCLVMFTFIYNFNFLTFYGKMLGLVVVVGLDGPLGLVGLINVEILNVMR